MYAFRKTHTRVRTIAPRGRHVSLLEIAVRNPKLAALLPQAFEREPRALLMLHLGVQGDVLIGQERRVGREDAVLGAQRHQLVDQLLVLAVHVDLVDEVAEPAHGPEPLDEVVAAIPDRSRPARRGIRGCRRSPPTLPVIRIVVRPDWR